MNLIKEINELKKKRGAVIIAHNYQPDEVQALADFTGDSLELSRKAAELDEDVIVFCGVHFMAETAAILSPEKTILLPDQFAGCPMADMITADQLRARKMIIPTVLLLHMLIAQPQLKLKLICVVHLQMQLKLYNQFQKIRKFYLSLIRI